MMISYCESLPEKRLSEEVFTQWNPHSDSKTEKINCYLDRIVTDESVTTILFSYFIPKNICWSEVYNFMKSEGLDVF